MCPILIVLILLIEFLTGCSHLCLHPTVFFFNKCKYTCFIWKYSEVFPPAECQHQHYLLLADEWEERQASYVWVKSGRPLCGWTLPGPSHWRLPLGPHRSCWAPVPSAPRSLGRDQVRAHDPKLSEHCFHLWDLICGIFLILDIF